MRGKNGKRVASSAREAALMVLLDWQRRGAWSDSALPGVIRAAGLSPRDAALASRLCYGVQQNLLLLEFWLNELSSVPASRMEEPVRLSILLGLYQMAFLDRIPARAAVDESVELSRRWSRNPRSPGLTNAILRAFDRKRDAMPEPPSLSVRYSHPQALVDLLAGELGHDRAELEELLRVDNSQPPTTIQTNPLRTTPQELSARLQEEGVSVQAHAWLPGCFTVTGTGDLEQLESFRDGLFQVQDAAARLAVLAAGPEPGMRVLDACAAPGGKSFQAAMEMGDRGEILACDLHGKKLDRLERGARRLGIGCIATRAMDARQFSPELEGRFDLVLTDVPCSGLGIIRKKPDIRYKDLAPLEKLPAIQLEILSNAARYVRPGGCLLYATCTVLRRENEAVIAAFLARTPEFHLEPFTLPGLGQCPGQRTLWPHRHQTDGFFMAKLRKCDD